MRPQHRRFALVFVGLLLLCSVLTACAFSVTGGIVGGFFAFVLGVVLVGVGVSTPGCDVGVCLEPTPEDVQVDTGDDLGMSVCLGALPPDVIGPCLSRPMDVGVCLGPLPTDLGVCLQPPPPDVIGPCLDPWPTDIGVCLSRPLDVGVCLEPPPPDIIGPCLDPPPEDVMGPCLSPPPPDVMGPCLSMRPPDAVGPCLDFDPDAFGPCLSIIPPPPDVQDDAVPMGPCLSMREGKAPQPEATQPAPETAKATPRDAVVGRVLARGGLPDDVAERLRRS